MSCSVLIFTLNEELHLPSCLDSLDWCDDIVIVDSYSTDKTQQICIDRKVRFYQNAFEGFGSQRNWALDQVQLKHQWVLVLDADERVPDSLAAELKSVAEADGHGHAAYQLRRRFHLWGRWLRYSSMYPTWVVRFLNKEKVRYRNRGHAETQTVDGSIGDLSEDLIDENKKGLGAWFDRQNRYAQREARYELDSEGDGSLSDLISSEPLRRRAALKRLARSLPFRGTLYFVYAYVLRGGFRDGRDGLTFCRMRAMYYSMVELHRGELRRAKGETT